MFVDVCVNLLLMLWHQMSGLVFLMSGQSDNLLKGSSWQRWVDPLGSQVGRKCKQGSGFLLKKWQRQKKGKFEQHANCIL